MLLPSIGVADVFQAAAIPVADGDTFQVLTDEKQRIQIRMADTDTPEPEQAFYKRANRNLGVLIREDARLPKEEINRPVCLVSLDDDDNNNPTPSHLGMAQREKGFVQGQTAEQAPYEQTGPNTPILSDSNLPGSDNTSTPSRLR